MSFKKPTILIFTSSVGSGHTSIAQAIKDIITSNAPDANIVISDISSKTTSRAYQLIGNHLNKPFANIWEWTNNPDTASFITKLYNLSEGEKVTNIIKKNSPNLIISTEAFSIYSTRQSLKILGRKIPHLVVIADLITIHHLWTEEKNADLFLAPITQSLKILIDRNIPKNKIVVTGLPIRSKFYTLKPCSPQPNTIFIGGSGEGHGDIYKIVKELVNKHKKVDHLNLIITCGKNKDLVRKLKKLKKPNNYQLAIHNYTKNIYPLIAKSLFVVGKPGPNILSEAIALNKPFIAVGNPLIQELGNYEYIDTFNIGSTANNPKFAAEKILNLINNQNQLEKFKKNLVPLNKQQKNTPKKIWNAISKFL